MSGSLRFGFFKPSGAIHIFHDVTFLQHKLWNFLLFHSYKGLSRQDEFFVPFKNILEFFELDFQSMFRIRKNLKALSQTVVKFNILEKDKENEWGEFPLLKDVDMEGRICGYNFDPRLQKLLCDSKLKTEIDLSVQRTFKSKYSLFIYELALDYKDEGKTPHIGIHVFRDFLGLKDDQYREFKGLNNRVIKKAVNEINEKTDLIIDTQLSYLKKTLMGIRFWIEEKKVGRVQQQKPWAASFRI